MLRCDPLGLAETLFGVHSEKGASPGWEAFEKYRLNTQRSLLAVVSVDMVIVDR